MTTRKHKPAPAAKKRPSAQASKPVKTVAAEKTAPVASVARDKERSKPAAAPKKGAGDAPHVKPVESKAVEAARPPEPKTAAPSAPVATEPKTGGPKNAAAAPVSADKKPLGIERRVQVMPKIASHS